MYRPYFPAPPWGGFVFLNEKNSASNVWQTPHRHGEFFVHQLQNAVKFLAIYISGVFQRIVKGKVILVHTPKCGGTYLHEQHGLKYRKNIRSVGHAGRQQYSNRSNERVVGLIRVPSDWYASYYWFCKKSLDKSPQSETNFPKHHPISLFSEDANVSFQQMILNMQDEKLLSLLRSEGVPAMIYGREIMDVFCFLDRTHTGFWTWTVMYHFADIATECIRTREDAIEQAQKIALSTDFIRQEKIDSDASKFLGVRRRKGDRINRAPRPAGWQMQAGIQEMIDALDGDVARIIYGHDELPLPASTIHQ